MGHTPRLLFLIFGKKFFFFDLRIFFVNIGPYGIESFKTLLLLQIAAKFLKLFLNFPPNGPHKTTVGIYEILRLRF